MDATGMTVWSASTNEDNSKSVADKQGTVTRIWQGLNGKQEFYVRWDGDVMESGPYQPSNVSFSAPFQARG